MANEQKQPIKKPSIEGFCCGEQDRTADLRVMNPTL
jgi:hypothetical protein